MKRNKVKLFLTKVKPFVEEAEIIAYQKSTKDILGYLKIKVLQVHKVTVERLLLENLPYNDTCTKVHNGGEVTILITLNGYNEKRERSENWKHYDSIEAYQSNHIKNSSL